MTMAVKDNFTAICFGFFCENLWQTVNIRLPRIEARSFRRNSRVRELPGQVHVSRHFTLKVVKCTEVESMQDQGILIVDMALVGDEVSAASDVTW